MYPQFNTTMNIRVEVKSADGSPTLPEHLKIFMEYRQETGVIRTDLNNNRKRMLQFRLCILFLLFNM